MKKIFPVLCLLITLFTLSSCEKESHWIPWFAQPEDTTDYTGRIMYPRQMMLHPWGEKVFIIDQGPSVVAKIYSVLTSTSAYIDSIELTSQVGYCDVGTHNGVNELYVGTTTGKLLIYNADNFTLTDEITVGPGAIRSVKYYDQKLFVSVDDEWSTGYAVISDRSQKMVKLKGYPFDESDYRLIPYYDGFTLTVACLSLSYTGKIFYMTDPEVETPPYVIGQYRDATGENAVFMQKDSKIICGYNGTVLDKKGKNIYTFGTRSAGYAVSPDQSTVYVINEKQVYAADAGSFNIKATYTSQYNPRHIAASKDWLFCVSFTDQDGLSNGGRCVVEKFRL